MPVPTEGKRPPPPSVGEDTMSPDDFKNWRKAMNFTLRDASAALGVSIASMSNYERGERREDGRPVFIPKHVALACAAVRAGLDPEGSDAVG